MAAIILRGDAAHLPLPDESVDLIVTSPPYWGLRSYTDGGEHYDGQIGSEETPGDYIAALLGCTREWMRVLKRGGSMFVNLGDAYSARADGSAGRSWREDRAEVLPPVRNTTAWAPRKSLLLLPERYRIACTDQLGLIARQVIEWHKVNGLPESVQDRCRRAHEDIVHLVKQPNYFAAVDEVREPHARPDDKRHLRAGRRAMHAHGKADNGNTSTGHALGRLPGSVWDIASQPLIVPEHLGLDHFAAFPVELPRRVILGWSPSAVCAECGQGRQPVTISRSTESQRDSYAAASWTAGTGALRHGESAGLRVRSRRAETTITGYACACTPYTDHPGTGKLTRRRDYNPSQDNRPHGTYGRHQAGEYERVGPWREYHLDGWDAPSARPAIVADPFGGTGTTALVADVLGRTGITVDRSADYCRLAAWRTSDPGERARAFGVPKPPPVPEGQGSLFDDQAGEAS